MRWTRFRTPPSTTSLPIMTRPGRSTSNVRLLRWEDGDLVRRKDVVTVEEPLEIRIALPSADGLRGETRSIAVTMRTPGHDFELAAGFLYTEGVLPDRGIVQEITYCRSGEAAQEYNVLEVRLRRADVDLDRLSRNVFTSSSCGVCGKASIEAVEVQGCAALPLGDLRLTPEAIAALPDRLRAAQSDFDRTGGLHAAGLFDAAGELVLLHEDVGRHNAVDKVVGQRFLEGGLPGTDQVLVLSGRLSFELVQKAVMAGIPMVVAVGAPSSLAIELAERFGVTLAGFVRGGGLNLYADPGRVRTHGDAGA